MAHSTKGRAGRKPNKPRPDGPLFPHTNGQWCKKVRGKLHCFGEWGNPDAALQRQTAIVGDSGTSKTPAFKQCMKPM